MGGWVSDEGSVTSDNFVYLMLIASKACRAAYGEVTMTVPFVIIMYVHAKLRTYVRTYVFVCAHVPTYIRTYVRTPVEACMISIRIIYISMIYVRSCYPAQHHALELLVYSYVRTCVTCVCICRSHDWFSFTYNNCNSRTLLPLHDFPCDPWLRRGADQRLQLNLHEPG